MAKYRKIPQPVKDLTTYQGIKENFESYVQYYQNPELPWFRTKFEPFWNTLAKGDDGWYMKVAIIDIDTDTGIQDSYDTIWFDIKPARNGITKAVCQIGGGQIWFEIEGNLPKVLQKV